MAEKKRKKLSGAPPGIWSEIIIEGYCTYHLAKEGKKTGYLALEIDEKGKLVIKGTSITIEDLLSGTKRFSKLTPTAWGKNIYYKPDKIPDYCKNKISIHCLGKDGKMCPFFRYKGSNLENLIEMYYGKEALDFLKGMRKR